MARIVVRDVEYRRGLETARELTRHLTRIAGETVRVRGPAACPIARIAGRHRQQIELFADTPGALGALLTTARREALIQPGEAMVIDVDPIALL